MNNFETPILFLIFNRPDLTKIVFERIRVIKPKYLFIAADGPRTTHSNDDKKCAATRKIVLDMIDWNCEVKTLFRHENLGCALAVSQAITWFFEHVEMGIILEDDCYPDLSFFSFCEKLLIFYNNNGRVMHIGGTNWQLGKKRGEGSYYFSSFAHVWGWATWKRCWSKYDHNIHYKINLKKQFKTRIELKFWQNALNSLKENKVDSWAYRWKFSIWENHGLCIVPQSNLVVNYGFGNDSTHTSNKSSNYHQIKLDSLKEHIKHPSKMKILKKADVFTIKTHYMNQNSITNRIISLIKGTLKP